MGACASRPQPLEKPTTVYEEPMKDVPLQKPPLPKPVAAAAPAAVLHTQSYGVDRFACDTASEYGDPADALTEAYKMISDCQRRVAVVRGSQAAGGVQSWTFSRPSSDSAAPSSVSEEAAAARDEAADRQGLPALATRAASDWGQGHAGTAADSTDSNSWSFIARGSLPATSPEQVASVPGVFMPEEVAALAVADVAYDVYGRGPPLPPCEPARLRAMEHYGPIDGPSDPNVGHVIDLLCQVFHVENALLALFGKNRIFVRNARGFERGDFPWRWSFCAWSMMPAEPEVLLVEDAKEDARFADNEVARALGVRFYCGAPLIGSSGQRLGTLCFVDSKPRTFPAEQLLILANLAEVVVRDLERGLADQARAARARSFMSRALECFDAGVAFVDTSAPGWRALHCSSAFTKATGITTTAARSAPFWELMRASGGGRATSDRVWQDACNSMAGRRTEFVLPSLRVAGAAERGTFSLRFRPAGRDALDESAMPVGIPAQCKSDPASGSQYFFAILASPLASSPSSGASSGGASWTASSQISSRSSSTSLDSQPSTLRRSSALMPNAVPFEGLELGPLVGRGSFGRVYRGMWQGKRVAVKVCTPFGKAKRYPAAWKSMEAMASAAGALKHPNVVEAFRHCTVLASEAIDLSEMSMVNGEAKLNSSDGCSQHSGGGGGSGAAAPPLVPSPFAAVNARRLASSAPGTPVLHTPDGPPPNPFAAVNAAARNAASAPPSLHGTPTGGRPRAAGPAPSPFAAANAARSSGSSGGSGRGGDSSQFGSTHSMPLGSIAPRRRCEAPVVASPFAAINAARHGSGEAPVVSCQRTLSRNDSARDSLDSAPAPSFGVAAALDGASPRSVQAAVAKAAGEKADAGHGHGGSSSGTSHRSGATSAPSGEVQTWLLTEYCDMGTLQSAVDKGWFRAKRAVKDGAPHLATILSVAGELAAAMAYLHARDVVHGDLAGGNVLLTSCDAAPHGFTAKVADFGLARQVALQDRIRTDTYGTVTHMPPELLAGGELSRAVDVYSFGVLLWEMYCGTRAFAGLTVTQVTAAVAVQGRKPLFPVGTPPEFAVLANACMAGNPESRPTFVQLESAISRLRIHHAATDSRSSYAGTS